MEHSFQEVMRQYKRLHDFYLKDNSHGAYTGFSCEGCPIRELQNKENTSLICFYHSGAQVYYPIISNMDEVERIVMAWAAENPEPVYPSWYAWLANMGAVPVELPPDQAVMLTDIGLLKKIPADIAQKLGIEPKEG